MTQKEGSRPRVANLVAYGRILCRRVLVTIFLRSLARRGSKRGRRFRDPGENIECLIFKK